MENSGNSYVVYGQLPWREEFKNNLIAEKYEQSWGEATQPWPWSKLKGISGFMRVILIVYRPLLTEVSTFSQIPVLVRSPRTFSLISLMLKKEFLSALMRMMATLSSAQI